MTNPTAHQPGEPCWIDLATSNLEASMQFYAQLFGWTYGESDPDLGGYTLAYLNNKAVAGLSPVAENPAENMWTLFFATDDIKKTSELIASKGGNIIAEPMLVPDLGHMLVATEPSGAVFGAWQAEPFIGLEVQAQPGALAWNDLRSTTPVKSRSFFSEVFGYEHQSIPMDNGVDYSVFTLANSEEQIGGIGDMMGMTNMPSHWAIYINVEELSPNRALVEKFGGKLLSDPMETPWGNMCAVADPNGASFILIDNAND